MIERLFSFGDEVCGMKPTLHRAAFTLLELLVVISIMALLLALLVPTVGRARRVAQVVVCSSNMKQVGIGLAIYLAENNEVYFPPWRHPTIIYSIEGNFGLSPFDNRENLIAIAGGKTSVYYCPLSDQEWWPVDSLTARRHAQCLTYEDYDPNDANTKYARLFHVQQEWVHYRTTLGYFMMVGMRPDGYNWSGTANPNGESPRTYPGHSEAALMADYPNNHSPSAKWPDEEPGNVLFGDGRVEIKSEFENHVSGYRNFKY